MKTFNITNISGVKLAINCETQQTAKKVLEALGTSFVIANEWTASTPVLAKHATENTAHWNTFHFAKERSYR